MKLVIDSAIIKALNPCKDRFDNWLVHYDRTISDFTQPNKGKKPFTYTLREFLRLPNITHQDKLWVVLRLVDNDTKVFFALDCAFSAAAYAAADAAAANATAAAANAAAAVDANAVDANAAAAAYAAAAAAAANAAAAAYAAAAANAVDANAAAAAYAAVKKEESRQLKALIYLIEGEKDV